MKRNETKYIFYHYYNGKYFFALTPGDNSFQFIEVHTFSLGFTSFRKFSSNGRRKEKSNGKRNNDDERELRKSRKYALKSRERAS